MKYRLINIFLGTLPKCGCVHTESNKYSLKADEDKQNRDGEQNQYKTKTEQKLVVCQKVIAKAKR